MSRIDVTHSEAIAAVMGYLRTALSLPVSACFYTLRPDVPPPIPKGGNYYLGFTAGGGNFGFSEDGGEQCIGQLEEETVLTITIYTRVRLDSTNDHDMALNDPDRGLLSVKEKVLSALIGQDPEVDGNGTFVTQLIHGINSGDPDTDGQGLAWLSLRFGLNFSWKLTAPV